MTKEPPNIYKQILEEHSLDDLVTLREENYRETASFFSPSPGLAALIKESLSLDCSEAGLIQLYRSPADETWFNREGEAVPVECIGTAPLNVHHSYADNSFEKPRPDYSNERANSYLKKEIIRQALIHGANAYAISSSIYVHSDMVLSAVFFRVGRKNNEQNKKKDAENSLILSPLREDASSLPVKLEERLQVQDSAPINATNQLVAAPIKLFRDINRYRAFKKSDFPGFNFPFFPLFQKWDRLNYTQLVACGIDCRVEYTLKIIRVIEQIDKKPVSLTGIFNLADLQSSLSFSNVPFGNAPADWPVVNHEKNEEYKITARLDLFSDQKRKIGQIYYALPHVKEFFVSDTDLLPIGHWNRRCSLGGMGVLYLGSCIKDTYHEILLRAHFSSENFSGARAK